jgi:MFS family permease
LLLVGVAVVVFYVMDSGGLNWSALYLQEALHASLTIAPLGLAGYQVGSIVCRAVADRLAIRFGPVRVVQAGTLVGMLGLLCIVAAPWPLLAIAGFFVTGLGLPVVAPFAFTAAAAASPGRPDVAIARLNLFNYAGTIIGSVLIGTVYAAGQLRLAFAIPLVLSGLIFLVARAFAPRTPAATVGETA